jgi:acyl-coenzyme A synthetase/AMP-(fatty) acid ligase
VNKFPISPAGKILRRELRQVAACTTANMHA